jgi:hypothetical protein
MRKSSVFGIGVPPGWRHWWTAFPSGKRSNLGLRVLTILLRFGVDDYSEARQQLDRLFQERLPEVERHVLVVDNALPDNFRQVYTDHTVIGGDNTAVEFSGFDCGVRFLGRAAYSYDLIHFATSAFNTLYVRYLELLDAAMLQAIAGLPVCLGHIDCYNEAVELSDCNSQSWARSCFFFLNPIELGILGSFVAERERHKFFSGDSAEPFLPEAPISARYRRYLLDWLTGQNIGQGVTWHSSFGLTAETLPIFERKALAIINEHLLSIRLRASGCRLIDMTWLSTMLRNGPATRIDWNTGWPRQLASRFRDAVVVPAQPSQD